MAKGKREWQEREMKMLSEWLELNYSGSYYATRVRLGTPPAELSIPGISPEEHTMTGIWRRWADGLVLLRDRVIIIEAAIRPDPGDISKLELYASLFPHTPEYREHAGKRLELILLYALEDPVLLRLAATKGIKTVYFRPSWLAEYLAILYPRERRSSIAGKELLSSSP
jgi:hypothetical protein